MIGRRNYVLEINAVLTLEAVERLLLRDAGVFREESNRFNASIIQPVLIEQLRRELS
jgi:hypothetical protein